MASARIVPDTGPAEHPSARSGSPSSPDALARGFPRSPGMLPEAAEVYSRAELVDSLSETVISTVRLFHWWRTRDWTTIRTTILGADPAGLGLDG